MQKSLPFSVIYQERMKDYHLLNNKSKINDPSHLTHLSLSFIQRRMLSSSLIHKTQEKNVSNRFLIV